MGNIGSQTGHLNQKQNQEEQQWAHSFPRTQPPRNHPQHKVLPERDIHQKLRHTNNGDILQSGGTLTGRQLPRSNHEKKGDEPESCRNEKTKEHGQPSKTYLPNQRDPLHKSGYRLEHKHQNGVNHAYREKMKRFGSEPDLRLAPQHRANDDFEMKEKRGKKKYKAPPPPKHVREAMEKSLEWEENSSTENSSPMRKTRLFKTREESKKSYSSPVHNMRSLDYIEKLEQTGSSNRVLKEFDIDAGLQLRERERNLDLRNNRLSLPEIKLMNTSKNFQEELREATKRLRRTKMEEDTNLFNSLSNDLLANKPNKEKLKTLDLNFNKKENAINQLKEIARIVDSHPVSPAIDFVRGECSGKESSPEQSPPRIITETSNEQPKMFYFGMDNSVENLDYSNDIIDTFTSNLHPVARMKVPNSSESEISSELEMDDSHSRSGIDLQLRPILPKKQLEIPRFSPAAAWKMLSSIDATDSAVANDDIPAFLEERIEKYARPPPPTIQMGQRSTNDKSGDSGISGDAGPTGYDDSPEISHAKCKLEIPTEFKSRAQGISWTPQQDLGDDSSLEEGINNINSGYSTKVAYSNRPHVFSLSLPRDNQLASYMGDKSTAPSTSLQKLKRSVSGVLGSLNKKDIQQANAAQDKGENWFLSRSAPNSLNNGFNSLEIKRSQKSDESDHPIVSSSKHNSGRVMYLPEIDSIHDRFLRPRTRDEKRNRSKSADRTQVQMKLSVFSKSCENITETKSNSEPEDLQDPPKLDSEWKFTRKPKRFTFQSTVRQIERRRIAEKLSREAEKKEKQRRRELEAMQKVEEEFQKKRAREKASIRQQLRLFSMDDDSWSGLPTDVEVRNTARPEPDGAVSSSATSSPSLPMQKPQQQTKKIYQKNKKVSDNTKYRPSSESSEENKMKAPITQILSEFHQPQREYKDYRGSNRFLGDSYDKQTTVHPKVTCKMPNAKASTSGNGTNYRRDFAHGVKTTKSGGSTYSDDSQSRTSPRMYYSKHGPITR